MTRIGRIKVHKGRYLAEYLTNGAGQICFQTVVENGGLWLGTWRCLGGDFDRADSFSIWHPVTIFERVS